MANPSTGKLRIGIDTGGTFTDVAWFDGSRLRTAKVPSRPDAPAQAVLDGLDRVEDAAGLLVCHGTTVGTNAILARHGGPACMVVLKGFRDLLYIGRGERCELYSPSPSRPKPLIDRDGIFEVDLRLDFEGKRLLTPTEESLKALSDLLRKSGARAVGIGTLHSAAFPSDEISLAEKLEKFSGLKTYASSALSAYPREYERWTLASVAAYLAPVLGEYLADLSRNCPSDLALMASAGGLVSPEHVEENPALCILSGPAGGALAALSLGLPRVLALDMGGTSTDMTLLAGKLPRTREAEIDGLPVPLPTIDIHTIGAGGGSIVKIDSGGMLALGPESAGAMPGPACYGNSGPATLSDVALLAGRLVPEYFLGGEMKLDKSASVKALRDIHSGGGDIDELIDGIINLAIVHLTGALRKISVARGIDPARPDAPITLVPFGGAGALFACECARSLGLKEVLHPNAAGVFSAVGLIQAPVVMEAERAILKPPSDCFDLLIDTRNELIDQLRINLAKWPDSENPEFTTTLECRYRGQTHAMDIPLPDKFNPGTIIGVFETAYKSRYTYTHEYDRVEIAAIRVRGEIRQPDIEFPDIEQSNRNMREALSGTTKLRLDGAGIDAPIYRRDLIPINIGIDGPALVVQDFATLYLPPYTTAHLDKKGHMLIEILCQ